MERTGRAVTAARATQGRPASGERRPWATAAVLTLMILAVLGLSSLLSVWLYRALLPFADGWAQVLVERGPVKFMRRVMVLVALPFLPWLLRTAGSLGWRDAGWSRVPGRRVDPGAARHAAIGLGLGVLTLGGASLASYALGGRILLPHSTAQVVLWVMTLALGAAVVALLEETAVRGFLLQVLERQWSFAWAALVSSVLFAWGHFYQPMAAAFDGEGVWRPAAAVVASGLSYPARIEGFGLRIFSLTLMGIVLCLSMRRFRTIWMAVGLHAGWVFVNRLSGNLGNAADASVTLPWIGQRSDATDGYVTVLLLAALAVGLFRPAPAAPDGAAR